MPIEQRVVSSKAKSGAGGTGGAVSEDDNQSGGKDGKGGGKGKRKLLIIVAIIAVLALNGAGWFFFIKPSGAPAPEASASVEAEHTPEPGLIAPVEPLSINLAGGHFLRLGFGIQLSKEASEGEHEFDVSEARDAAIALYSGRELAAVNDGVGRDALKAELVTQLNARYGEGHVLDVYLTDYVTQ